MFIQVLVEKCLALLVAASFCIGTTSAPGMSLCSEISTFLPKMCQYDAIRRKCQSACAIGQHTGGGLTCGKRSTFKRRFRRIVGGNQSAPGEWPWHVSLHLNGTHSCGASILSPHYVITAAHCLDDEYTSDEPMQFTVVAGTNKHSVPGQKVRVRSFVKHPGYNISFHPRDDLYFVYAVNDIAIIKLADKLDLGSNNQDSICLPDKLNRIPDNYQCYIVGYGMTKFYGEMSDFLRHAKIKTVPIDECNKPVSYNQTINSSITICGGDGTPSISPCNFDSGGGFVCQKDGTWYIAGIISSGYKCGGHDAYGLYTKVAEYEGWIAKALIELNNNEDDDTDSSCNQLCASVLLQCLLTAFAVVLTSKDFY